MMNRLIISCVSLLSISLTGCINLSPEYERPKHPLNSSEITSTELFKETQNKLEVNWIEILSDQYLKELISAAIEENRDLQKAALTVQKASAAYRIETSSLYPDLGVSTGMQSEKVSGVISRPISVGGIISSYELDFFNRLHNLSEAALEEYLALESTHKTIKVNLIAEVISNYLTLTANVHLKKLNELIVERFEQELELVKQRVESGIESELELLAASRILEGAKLDLIARTNEITKSKNILELLTGGPLPDDNHELNNIINDSVSVFNIPNGVPATLLLNRPDIISLEHKLKAANANIGAARAAYFPSITLTGFYGSSSNELSGLLEADSESWNFSPQLYLPIFNSGQIDAQVRVAEVTKEILIAEYEQSIREAFKEVADTLAMSKMAFEQLGSEKRRSYNARLILNIVNARSDIGTASSFDVLEAERLLYLSQTALINTKLRYSLNVVAFYRVLGGTWNVEEPQLSQKSPAPSEIDLDNKKGIL
jgi:multidrug efflux system outer membrane protein